MRLRAGGHARAAGLADLRGHRRGHRRPSAKNTAAGCCGVCGKGRQDRPGPAAASRRPGSRLHSPRADPAQHLQRPEDQHAAAACSTSPKAPASRSSGHTRTCCATLSLRPWLDAGVDLRDVQIAARHADPRATMWYDRARQNPRPPPELHPGRLHDLRHLTEPASPGALAAGDRPTLPNRGRCYPYNYALAPYIANVMIHMPTKEEVSILEPPRGAPVAEAKRTGYAEDGTPLRVMVTTATGDPNTLFYEMDAS